MRGRHSRWRRCLAAQTEGAVIRTRGRKNLRPPSFGADAGALGSAFVAIKAASWETKIHAGMRRRSQGGRKRGIFGGPHRGSRRER